MKQVSPTQLRRDIYALLDSVLESGEPLEVMRNGQRLLIVATGTPKRSVWDVPPGRESALRVSWEELEETSFDYVVDDELFPLLAADQ